MDTHTQSCAKDFHGSSLCHSSLFCQEDFSPSCKHNILPCRCQCWLSGCAHLCFPCSSHTWLCSQPCSCLADSLSASFTSQWLLHTLPKFRTCPPLWLAAQFAAVAACSATSLGQCYSHTSLGLGSRVLLPSPEEGNKHWGKNIPLRALWGIPAEGFSRVELVPGVVCVGTSLCAFLRKAEVPGYLICPEHL